MRKGKPAKAKAAATRDVTDSAILGANPKTLRAFGEALEIQRKHARTIDIRGRVASFRIPGLKSHGKGKRR